MSRQTATDDPTRPPTAASNLSPAASPVDTRADNSAQSSASPRRMSKDSEGYPSWLPKRPPHPPPASTFHSSVGMPEPGPSEPMPHIGGRKPTPRSVRIVSLQDHFTEKSREPTDQTKVNPPTRVWSRATGAAMSNGLFAATDALLARAPPPRFHAKGLHLELLQSPSVIARLFYYVFPIIVFAHIPLQSFFDFNAVFILFQVSRFPNPEAPGVPGSGKNWALGAVAYIACWLVWILVVFVIYELIYSFARRWRVKRPIMLPIYLSSPAYNYAAMTSYTNFCFFQHLRYSAFFGENGSLRDGLAETFWYYSQNLPTIALLLPRAGLCLALLFAFSTPQVGLVVLADAGISQRDATFFRTEDGTLTSYARGILIFNAVWTAWRLLVLLCSWIGLWVLSGHGCAGLCGPRNHWEVEDGEKFQGGETASEMDVLPWSWRDCTRLRIQEAFDFCLTLRSSHRWSQTRKEPTDVSEVPSTPFEGMEQVLAAAGFPSQPPPARRGILSDDLFERPQAYVETGRSTPPELSDIIPKVVKRSSKDKDMAGPSAPLMKLPYPFTAAGAQYSSADKVPFPPSPAPSRSKKSGSGTTHSQTGTGSGSGSPSGSSEHAEEDEEEEEEDEDEDEDVEDDEDIRSEDPSSGRASGSMSSLGQPIHPASKYPFQYRRPGTASGSGRGTSFSSGATQSRSPQSRVSGATSQSTGNRESTDSQSPRSHTTSSDEFVGNRGIGASPISFASSAGASTSASPRIPMPPRHPQPAQGRGRARAGTMPAITGSMPVVVQVPTSPSPVAFPRAVVSSTGGVLGRGRVRADSGLTTSELGVVGPRTSVMGSSAFGSDLDLALELDDEDLARMMGQQYGQGLEGEADHEEGSQEALENEDSVGLLGVPGSRGPSPRTSFIGLRGSRSRTHSATSGSAASGSGHGHPSASGSGVGASASVSGSSRSRADSLAVSVRERTQSLMQGIGAASQSSLDVVRDVVRATTDGVRSRTNSSVARLQGDHPSGHRGYSHVQEGVDEDEQRQQRQRRLGLDEGGREEDEEEVAAGMSSDAGRTHSRSGSATTGVSSGNENYTFGHPLRMPPVQEGRSRTQSHQSLASRTRTDSQFSQSSRARTDSYQSQIPPRARTESYQSQVGTRSRRESRASRVQQLRGESQTNLTIPELPSSSPPATATATPTALLARSRNNSDRTTASAVTALQGPLSLPSSPIVASPTSPDGLSTVFYSQASSPARSRSTSMSTSVAGTATPDENFRVGIPIPGRLSTHQQQHPFLNVAGSQSQIDGHPSAQLLQVPGQPGTSMATTESNMSRADLSTAAPSFVTAPATVEGSTTGSSGGAPSSWGTTTTAGGAGATGARATAAAMGLGMGSMNMHMPVDRDDGTWARGPV